MWSKYGLEESEELYKDILDSLYLNIRMHLGDHKYVNTFRMTIDDLENKINFLKPKITKEHFFFFAGASEDRMGKMAIDGAYDYDAYLDASDRFYRFIGLEVKANAKD